ncbi:unnamed protein product [Vitrella brassicaformis CCMP3155]|uniref:Uncharacterized protein n=2 Tax=Vitrella brassicaformis TaxID=1169539 RepID=A0A0G4FBZ6_VITBC|nr:unnamed protein product [Vitrella brassicaformis CCMP3155]|eukprot:CEM10122.1 unnamed protein product [Vitrella brassicaformis CCMP3155]
MSAALAASDQEDASADPSSTDHLPAALLTLSDDKDTELAYQLIKVWLDEAPDEQHKAARALRLMAYLSERLADSKPLQGLVSDVYAAICHATAPLSPQQLTKQALDDQLQPLGAFTSRCCDLCKPKEMYMALMDAMRARDVCSEAKLVCARHLVEVLGRISRKRAHFVAGGLPGVLWALVEMPWSAGLVDVTAPTKERLCEVLTGVVERLGEVAGEPQEEDAHRVGPISIATFICKLMERVVPSLRVRRSAEATSKESPALHFRVEGHLAAAALFNRAMFTPDDAGDQHPVNGHLEGSAGAQQLKAWPLLCQLARRLRQRGGMNGAASGASAGSVSGYRYRFDIHRGQRSAPVTFLVDMQHGEVRELGGSSMDEDSNIHARIQLLDSDFVRIATGEVANPLAQVGSTGWFLRESCQLDEPPAVVEMLRACVRWIFRLHPDFMSKLRGLPIHDACSDGGGDMELTPLGFACITYVMLVHKIQEHQLPLCYSTELLVNLHLKASYVLLKKAEKGPRPPAIFTRQWRIPPTDAEDDPASAAAAALQQMLAEKGHVLLHAAWPYFRLASRQYPGSFVTFHRWTFDPRGYFAMLLESLPMSGDLGARERASIFKTFADIARLFKWEFRVSLYLELLAKTKLDKVAAGVTKVIREDWWNEVTLMEPPDAEQQSLNCGRMLKVMKTNLAGDTTVLDGMDSILDTLSFLNLILKSDHPHSEYHQRALLAAVPHTNPHHHFPTPSFNVLPLLDTLSSQVDLERNLPPSQKGGLEGALEALQAQRYLGKGRGRGRGGDAQADVQAAKASRIALVAHVLADTRQLAMRRQSELRQTMNTFRFI